jgi:epoxyqueuosine reductase
VVPSAPASPIPPVGPSGAVPIVALAHLRGLGAGSGLAAVAATTADRFPEVRSVLEDRRAAGLHGGMQFTYRNPARSTDPAVTGPWARTLVVGARAYGGALGPPPDDARPWARVARYAVEDVYAELRVGLDAIADELRAHGARARVLADDNALVDRAVAHRAGLGWFGKSTNLLLPGRGSWFVLGSVLTDAAVGEHGVPVDDGCGPCTRCLSGCPTGAIVEPGVVDARRCLAWLLQAEGVFPAEHRVALGDRIYGCDDCQEVCPPNRHPSGSPPPVVSRSEPARRGGTLGPWLDVLALLALDDEALLGVVERWYVPRRDGRYLRRNLLVVLGNTGRGDDPAAVAALTDHLAHPDPLVRAHAVWAAARLGRRDLLGAVAGDDDPLVRAEVAAAPTVPLAAMSVGSSVGWPVRRSPVDTTAPATGTDAGTTVGPRRTRS